MTDHRLSLEPQPIADQWMGRCRCGWRETASIYEHATRENAISHIKHQFSIHLAEKEIEVEDIRSEMIHWGI